MSRKKEHEPVAHPGVRLMSVSESGVKPQLSVPENHAQSKLKRTSIEIMPVTIGVAELSSLHKQCINLGLFRRGGIGNPGPHVRMQFAYSHAEAITTGVHLFAASIFFDHPGTQASKSTEVPSADITSGRDRWPDRLGYQGQGRQRKAAAVRYSSMPAAGGVRHPSTAGGAETAEAGGATTPVRVAAPPTSYPGPLMFPAGPSGSYIRRAGLTAPGRRGSCSSARSRYRRRCSRSRRCPRP